jgi:hypothetical protein
VEMKQEDDGGGQPAQLVDARVVLQVQRLHGRAGRLA